MIRVHQDFIGIHPTVIRLFTAILSTRPLEHARYWRMNPITDHTIQLAPLRYGSELHCTSSDRATATYISHPHRQF